MLKKLIIILILVTAIALFALAHRPPKEIVLQTDVLNEASGIDLSIQNKQVLWSHNDSGNKAEIYALNTEGQLLSTLTLKGVQNRDWEDIAVAKDPLSILGKAIFILLILVIITLNTILCIFTGFKEPLIANNDKIIQSSQVDTIEIQYEDGHRDAEAIFLEPKTGDIYLISKRRAGGSISDCLSFQFQNISTAERICSLPFILGYCS